MVKAVRGAVKIDEDTRTGMEHWVPLLVTRVMQQNDIQEKNIISIIFSQTGDLTACNPATALRTTGFNSVPLFCTLEPEYPESLPCTVRLLMNYVTDKDAQPIPIYLNGAEVLRKDLFQHEK